MSFFDTIDNVKYQFGRFFWPSIFFIVGLVLLKIALVPAEVVLNNDELLLVEQSKFFLYGAIFFVIGSVVWFLYLFGVVKTFLGYAIMVLMLVASAFLLYNDYATVDNDVKYIERFDKIERDIKARMLDIKSAQSAYKEYNRHFTNNIDSLIYFVKTGKKMSVPNKGSLPDRQITPEERDYIYGDNRPIDKLMNEREANKLAHSPNPPADLKGFSRDTIYLPVLDAIFYDERYIEKRAKSEATIGFHPDSMRYVPYSGGVLVTMDTSSVTKGEIRVPALMIKMVHPMDKEKVYQIGDLNDNHLRDNWSR